MTLIEAPGPPFRILSIDPGTNKTGYAVLEYDFATHSRSILMATTLHRTTLIKAKPWIAELHGEREAAVNGYGCALGEYLVQWAPDAVISEAPFMGRFPQSFMALTELVSHFRNIVMEWDLTIPLQIVKPSAVKKVMGVSGKSGDKDLMLHALRKLNIPSVVDIETLDDNAVDACCVGLYGIEEMLSTIPPWE